VATPAEVQHLLACWFQLGKPVLIGRTGEQICPQPVLQEGWYSRAFEESWQLFVDAGLDQCWLANTDLTLAKMCQEGWEIVPCARCGMPEALPVGQISPLSCACSDMANWPTDQLPPPHSPLDVERSQDCLRNRLLQLEQTYLTEEIERPVATDAVEPSST
jgi:hypothetical protein